MLDIKPAHDPAASIEEDLSRRVLDCEPNAMEAAVVIFERAEPATLVEAVGLVGAYGELTPEALDRITRAYDRYWHLRDMPCS